MALTLSSTAFPHQGDIPRQYTCEGDDMSPALRWDGVPVGAQSLVLIVDDPDAPDPAAPRMVWVHWVLYNLQAGWRFACPRPNQCFTQAGSRPFAIRSEQR